MKGIKDGPAEVFRNQWTCSSVSYVTPEPDTIVVDLLELKAIGRSQDVGRVLNRSHSGEVHRRKWHYCRLEVNGVDGWHCWAG